MTTSTALLFFIPIAIAGVDAIMGPQPGAIGQYKDIGVVGLLVAGVAALWQDRNRDRADREKDRDTQAKLIAELSAHIASSTEVQRNTATEIAQLGEIIRHGSETRQQLIDALRELSENDGPRGKVKRA